ncbi:MAG TPA: preprotein translocase subunit YajC [bacterium]|nr:preprotein translocase subunit YajC [bacterium]HOL46852.1 preprotein translocase subunit YajC [bacterium]HPQ18799.1 preprotein translocase subunit YajC [bacterium]
MFYLFSTLFAMAQPPAQSAQQPGQAASLISMLFPLIIVFLIFYLLVFLPQKKQQKQHQEMLNTLKKGDKVITSAGIYGQITNIDNNTVTIKIDDNAKMKVLKSVISRIITEEKNEDNK